MSYNARQIFITVGEKVNTCNDLDSNRWMGGRGVLKMITMLTQEGQSTW